MIFNKFSKLTIISVAFSLLFLTVVPSGNVLAQNGEGVTTKSGEEVVEISISNQEIFDAYEEIGYNIEDYLSDEEIEQALIEDSMNYSQESNGFSTASIGSGHTGITIVNQNTANLHLNSTMTTLLIGTGVGATAGALLKIPAIASFFSQAGIGTSALEGFLGTAAGLLPSAYPNGISITFRYHLGGMTITQVYAQ